MRAKNNSLKSRRLLDSRDCLVKACMQALEDGEGNQLVPSPKDVIRNAPKFPVQCEATDDGLPILIFLRCPICHRPHSLQGGSALRVGSLVWLTPDTCFAALTHPECITHAIEDEAVYLRMRRAVAGSLLHAIHDLGDLGDSVRSINRMGVTACPR